jgi:protein-glutamine gamma-glutamyltransferase
VTFDTFFRSVSYLAVASAALTLFVCGGLSSPLAVAFAGLLALAWKLENSRWQLSERAALFVVLAGLPLLYLDWLFQARAGSSANVTALVHLTLFLSSIKLLQIKGNRDWLFLYLIAFFEVLLAAGLSVSLGFFASLCLYVFLAITSIVAFEIKKASGASNELRIGTKRNIAAVRLPLVSALLLAVILVFAIPVFFIVPRFNSSALARGDHRVTGLVGFSDGMRLGDIGVLQQRDEIVMRVRVERPPSENSQDLRWRGVALDYFDGLQWANSDATRTAVGGERNLFQLGTIEDLDRLTTQTFFVEPLDTIVLFAAPRVVALHGELPRVSVNDSDALFSPRRSLERVTYRVYSDTQEPAPELLRADRQNYDSSMRRYIQLPRGLDSRIEELARDITARAGAQNRYDTARAIEAYLSQTFGYTLQMRASGRDPLSDFLFRVREGHCEYFSSAMVVMLRTQGISARVVNGFQMGEYNSASGAYTVRQRHAHSWVEVYFPATRSWVTFDPTPPTGRPSNASGAWSALGKYTDALELYWIQYVVGYDRQEQRTLAVILRSQISSFESGARERWNNLRNSLAQWNRFSIGGAKLNDTVFVVVFLLVSLGLAITVFFLAKRIRIINYLQKKNAPAAKDDRQIAISFYQRLMRLLESRGLVRSVGQTPLEFAAAADIPDAIFITRAYHQVRYGARDLTADEKKEIEDRLRRMEIGQQVTERVFLKDV